MLLMPITLVPHLRKHNPDAEQRWGEVAKSRDMEDIRRVARNAIKENL